MMYKILALAFCLLLFTLLIGQMFGFEWAGGEGYDPHLRAEDTTTGNQFRRGETITTLHERQQIRIGEATIISLDTDTTITLVATTLGDVAIRLSRGRLLVTQTAKDGSFRLITNFHESHMESGTAYFENNEERSVVSIVPLDGTTVEAFTKQDGATETVTRPVGIFEVNPVTRTEFDFEPFDSNPEFFHWTFETYIPG